MATYKTQAQIMEEERARALAQQQQWANYKPPTQQAPARASSAANTAPARATPTYQAPAPTPINYAAAPAPAASNGYTPGANVNQSYQQYLQMFNSQPDAYQSQWQPELYNLYNQMANRGPFQYDLNGDMLYQQMRDQYTKNGQLAMQDSMGQAAAMTGGYGNSYAGTVGQQTYNGYMQELNNNLPQLYDRAYGQYQNEGQELAQQFGMAGQMESNEYGKYRDLIGDWQWGTGTALDQYNNEKGFDYGAFTDKRAYDQQQAEWEYKKQQDAQALAMAQQKAAGSSSSRGGTTPAWKQLGFASYEAYQEYMEERLRQEQEAEQAKYIKQYVTHSKTFGAGM